MSASFAKAVIPRPRKRRGREKESEWELGWVFPIKMESPAIEAELPPALCHREEEASTEDRS
jgi:hypothetical protein